MSSVPSPYRRPMGAGWWLSGRYRSPSRQGRGAYLLFMLREFTSVLIVLFLLLTLAQLSRLGSGEADYTAFLSALRSPAALLFYLVVLIATLYHAMTWLHSLGVAMVVRLGGRSLRRQQLVSAGYAAWAVISLAVLLVLVL